MLQRARPLAGALIAGLLAISVVVIDAAPASAEACAPESAAVWGAGACEQAGSAGGVIVEQVAFTPPGRPAVAGAVCRPAAPGRYPVIVLNHAAAEGIGVFERECLSYPTPSPISSGFVVLLPDYRPNDSGGPPTDEVCSGQVDDVAAMIDRARGLPFVDGSRITMRGVSLGGCITLRAHQGGIPGLRAAAALNPPTDLAALYGHSAQRYRANLCTTLRLSPLCPAWGALRDGLATVMGGPPGPATIAAYAADSALAFVDDTVASEVPLMVAQGALDPMVPLSQTCAFAAAIADRAGPGDDPVPVRYALGAGGPVLQPAAPSGCPGLGPWATSDPVYAGFPADRYFVAYDDLQHTNPTNPYLAARLYADYFLMLKAVAAP